MKKIKENSLKELNHLKGKPSLNPEQKDAKALILDNKVIVLKGLAGSGKTHLATNVAIDMLEKNYVDKVIISRPMITAGEPLGFLPGSLNEKIDPYLKPIYEGLEVNSDGFGKKESLMMDGSLEITTVGLLRGRNFKDCVVIIDEAENLTKQQTKLILTRLCTGSKIIFCGDLDQCDLKTKKDSGFDFLCTAFNQIKGFVVIDLKTNHRDEIVPEILAVYDKAGIE